MRSENHIRVPYSQRQICCFFFQAEDGIRVRNVTRVQTCALPILSVTDRCNFRCVYCMPKEIFGDDFVFLPKDELLTFDEMVRIAKVYTRLGVKKIRITGGEPL